VPGVKLRLTAGDSGIAHPARYPQVRLIRKREARWALFERAE
jgi:hypothetical protein